MTQALPKAGRYELLEELGRGAMGVVYRAHDPVIGRTVAVKTMRLSEEGTGMTHEELISRFQTEARAAGLLTHPNIVVVYDAGEEEGLFYITMELVEGRSLQALLDAQQTFPLPRVLRIMEQTCSALEFAHQRNVVHRDIKPANLMLTADDTVKVTDFGTAKILQFGTTQTAQVIGTPSYMSPEQIKGKSVDGRSDIFSLGVILYELVTGEKPFPGQNLTTVIYKIVNEDPIPPRELDSSVHPGLSNVITRSLAKQAEARYQSCREFMEALRNYRQAGGVDSTVAMPAAGVGATERTIAIPRPLAPGAAAGMPAGAGLAQTAPRKRRWDPLLALLLLAVIAGAGHRLWPYMKDIWQRSQATGTAGQGPGSNAPPSQVEPGAGAAPAETPPVHVAEGKPAEEPPAVKSRATEFKTRIEQKLAKDGLAGKVHIRVAGNTLTFSGKLTSAEHRGLLAELHNAPPSLRIIDHIEYAGDASKGGDDAHKPIAGRGEIDVLTDVLGAAATLRDPNGRAVLECRTPCRFHDLAPSSYKLEVSQPGYRPQQHTLTVRAGVILEDRMELQPVPTTLTVNTRPPQAFVFVNGERQPDQTPTTIRLAPGTYNIALRKPGFNPYFGQVELKPNEASQLDIELALRPATIGGGSGGGPAGSRGRMGGQLGGRGSGASGKAGSDSGADQPAGGNTDAASTNMPGVTGVYVVTDPPGAQILVDGFSVRPRTPAQINLSPGEHTITLTLRDYTPARRTIMVEANQLTQINVTLH